MNNENYLEDFDKLICLDYPPYAFANTPLPNNIELPNNFYVTPPRSKEWYKWFRKKQIRRVKNDRQRSKGQTYFIKNIL